MRASSSRPRGRSPIGSVPHGEAGAPHAPVMEPLAVRIPQAVRLTGIGRSKLYELIAAEELEIVKVGAITLIAMDSLKGLIERSRRKRRD